MDRWWAPPDYVWPDPSWRESYEAAKKYQFPNTDKRSKEDMTSRDFCYWLQGMFELHPTQDLDKAQTELIRRHLAMVFKHEIDPSFPNADTLRAIHDSSPSLDDLKRTQTFDEHGRPNIMC